jgi:lipopolysaccharide transport system permease protein
LIVDPSLSVIAERDALIARQTQSAGKMPEQGIAPPNASADAVLVIAPPEERPPVDVRELWSYRGLIFFLVWRDLKVRYAQTVLGAAWAIVQPVLTMIIFTVIFGHFARVPSDGVPYAAFSLAAVVPWTYFATSLTTASLVLVNNRDMLTKVYFPRLALTLSAILTGLVDFAIAFVIVLIVTLSYGILPSVLSLVVIPLLVVILAVAATGMGAWLGAMAVQYRDIKHIVPFLVQIWMYASPIVYPLSIVPERYRWLYMLNPMVGVIEGFRAVLLRTTPVPWQAIGMSVIGSLVLLTIGVRYFRRAEHIFADVV